jgi:hypothetical protein
MRHMRIRNLGMALLVFSAAAFLLPIAVAGPLGIGGRQFEIYFVDVEGGQATLIVNP